MKCLSFAILMAVGCLGLAAKLDASTSNSLRLLAHKAIDPDETKAAAAIRQLRAAGQTGLDAMIETHAATIDAFCAQRLSADDANWRRVTRAIDTVAAQRDAYASRLFWYTDLDQAKAVAQATSRPILSLRLLGNLNDEYSCANSRFFRTVLYANHDVSETLRYKFVLHWQSMRPVPKMTIDFGDGRRLERTVTGNSIHWVLDSHGRVIDALPGLYGATTFLRVIRQARTMSVESSRSSPSETSSSSLSLLDCVGVARRGLSHTERATSVADYHARQRRSLEASLASELRQVGHRTASDVGAPSLRAPEWMVNVAPLKGYARWLTPAELENDATRTALAAATTSRAIDRQASAKPVNVLAIVNRLEVDRTLSGIIRQIVGTSPTTKDQRLTNNLFPARVSAPFNGSIRRLEAGPSASVAMRVTVSKGMVEAPLLAASMPTIVAPGFVQLGPNNVTGEANLLVVRQDVESREPKADDRARSEPSLMWGSESIDLAVVLRGDSDETMPWPALGQLHIDEARLDAASRALMSRKTSIQSRDRVSYERMVTNLERSIAIDTVRNQYGFRHKILEWLQYAGSEVDVAELNERVYGELFLTPSSDPWLGLVPNDTYTALDEEGLCVR